MVLLLGGYIAVGLLVLVSSNLVHVAEGSTKCKCGVPNKSRSADLRIMGGAKANKNEFPWQVYLNLGEGWCGGSLISSKTVLTAAHCIHHVSTGSIKVYVEAHDVQHGKFRQKTVKKKIEHPGYEFKTNEKGHLTYVKDDIALLTLKKPVKFSRTVQPICLPPSRGLHEHAKAIVSGWGQVNKRIIRPAVLRKAEVDTQTNEACQKLLTKKKKEDKSFVSPPIRNDMICASGEHKASCRGDSGGPLITKNKSGRSYFIIGVASFGEGCDGPGRPVVYTRVTSYLPWIKKHLEGNKCSPPGGCRFTDKKKWCRRSKRKCNQRVVRRYCGKTCKC